MLTRDENSAAFDLPTLYLRLPRISSLHHRRDVGDYACFTRCSLAAFSSTITYNQTRTRCPPPLSAGPKKLVYPRIIVVWMGFDRDLFDTNYQSPELKLFTERNKTNYIPSMLTEVADLRFDDIYLTRTYAINR